MTIANRVRFEEPPKRIAPKKTKNKHVADALRAHPGEWGRVATYTKASSANSVAYQIRQGKLLAFAPQGAFEAVSRTVSGEYRVYARYIGPDGDRA